MSAETLQWLNQNTLIGFTEKRGNAWHYKASEQGSESNHYDAAIPVEDVRRRLFPWHAVEGQITAQYIGEDGVLTVTDEERKAIMRSDTGSILGIFKQGYTPHQYDEWLLTTVANILDDSLSIGSAGLLKGGAVAWVSVEVPDNIVTPSGVEFRPNLLAATSLDGSLATTFKRVVTNVVCDNTMEAGLIEPGQQFKVRHSRYSQARLSDMREALEIVHSVGDEFTAQVEQLTNMTVTDSQWELFLESLSPTTELDGSVKKGRSLSIAQNKQERVTKLWNDDERVTPWRNTAYGVVQAINTYEHHVAGATQTEAKRAERNMFRAVTGKTGDTDRETMEALALVLA